MIEFLPLKRITARYADELHGAASRVIDSGWYLQGSENAEFEKAYAAYTGTAHCVGCANGLDALTLIFRAYKEMGIMKDGDEVIVPANTYIASILSVTENGLTPVLVEPREDTLEIDDSLIEERITPRTRAIFIVHLYGRLAWTRTIADLCRKHSLKLIEDNAQAQGCKAPDGTRTGALGDAAGHSFYPGKNIGAFGDGGAVTTDDAQLALTVRALANYGSQQKYVFKYRGRNSRLDELQAAVLGVKLRHLDEDNAARGAVASYYREHISNPLVTLPLEMPSGSNVWHQFPIFCEHRDALQAYLKSEGIGTMIHYPIPPHKQECYKEWNGMLLPVTEKIHRTELSIPIHPALSAEEAAQVVSAVNSFAL